MAIKLTIVTPEGTAFDGPVDSVVLPGSEGDFGVLEHHERFLAPLRAGKVEIRTENETQYAAIAKGFADVSGERVVVLVDSCELASEIDLARAERALDRAREKLSELRADDEADARHAHEAEEALARALTRIEVAGRK